MTKRLMGAQRATAIRETDNVALHGGFLVDVPVTLTVAVRGPGLTEQRALEIAREFADALAPTQDYMRGYASVAGEGTAVVTEATLESPTDEVCEVLDELEPDEE